jgi:hypothetical protein
MKCVSSFMITPWIALWVPKATGAALQHGRRGRGRGAAPQEAGLIFETKKQKLLLLRLYHVTRALVSLRGCKLVKVFWFFFSKKEHLAVGGNPHRRRRLTRRA